MKMASRGAVTTNSAESSFALLKRGLHGTFHAVSEWASTTWTVPP